MSSNTALKPEEALKARQRPIPLSAIHSAGDEVTLQCLLCCSSMWQPSRWWMQVPLLYSRGKCTDIFVPTERQADRSKGSALVEHLCYLRGQIACWGHQYFSKVTCPGCRLFLRSTIRKKQERCVELRPQNGERGGSTLQNLFSFWKRLNSYLFVFRDYWQPWDLNALNLHCRAQYVL